MNYTLDQALSLILDLVTVVDRETVDLAAAEGRVSAVPITARLPDPPYDQSTRDGFVLGPGGDDNDRSRWIFQVCGEIPAGRSDRLVVGPAEAYRIMTGSLVPDGAARVVAQEDCRLNGSQLEVPTRAVLRENRFIQRVGSRIARGEPVVASGTPILAEQVALLAATGNGRVPVFRRPRVAFLCSGSELVGVDDPLLPGQKISSNRYLLGSLIRRMGGVPVDFGIVCDDTDLVGRRLEQIVLGDCDVIVSTGGVGPGKYDVFAAAFQAVGGVLFYNRLAMRPGRSTLFGMIGDTLYFGLPGPPSAVASLFNEILRPVLGKMKGLASFHHETIEACLSHDLLLRGDDLLLLREGVLSFVGGSVFVRSPEHLEVPDCYILLEPGKCPYNKGALVTVHRQGWRW